MKRVLLTLVTLSVLLSASLTVYAHDVPRGRNNCSIEVLVRYDGKNLNSGTLTAVQVGFVAEYDGNYFFGQEMTGDVLDDITSPDAAKEQKKFYYNNKSAFEFETQTQSIKNGKATFSDLSTGLYLIVQEKECTGFEKMDAFLVSVPYLEDGTYRYDVTASVKSELERPDPDPTDPPPKKPTGSKLPQTGQLNWPIPLMAISGLVLFTIGWILYFGKKRDPYEK